MLLLATSESIEYVLSRLRHFDWSAARLDSIRAEVFQPCGEAIRAATFRRWPTMQWSERADILSFLGGHQLLNDPLLALLTEVDFGRLSPADLLEYVEGLWHFLDRRTIPQVRKILDQALQDAERGDAEAKRVVQTMFALFGDGLDSWLTADLPLDPVALEITSIRSRLESQAMPLGKRSPDAAFFCDLERAVAPSEPVPDTIHP